MVQLSFGIVSLALAATTLVSAVPLEERKAPSHTFVSDNDLVDAKNLNIDLDLLNNLDILKRKAPSTTFKSDNDGVDLKGLKIDLDLLNNLDLLGWHHHKTQSTPKSKGKTSSKSGSKTTFIGDNDLVDAKNINIDVDALNNADILKRAASKSKGKTTIISDNDLIDLKNLKLNLNLLNNLDLLKRSEEIIGNIVARSEGSGLEERGRSCSTKFVSDNDLIDLKNLKAFLSILRRDEPAAEEEALSKRGVYYSDNDLLDLKDLGVNINVLSGRPRYCVPVHRPTPTPKPTKKPTHTPRPTTTKKTPCTTTTTTKKTPKPTPKPTKKPQPTCSRGYDFVSYGSTYGDVVVSDNDLIDLKDLSINVCILDFSGKCGKDSGRKPASSWTCQSSEGCCVKKGTKSTTVVDDDDLLDLKNIGINLGILNF